MENGGSPATKKDLDELRAAGKQDLAALRNELRTDLIDMETRIIKAFYGYTRTNDKNMKQLGLLYGGVGERVEVIERRVLDIEERLNMPPQTENQRSA